MPACAAQHLQVSGEHSQLQEYEQEDACRVEDNDPLFTSAAGDTAASVLVDWILDSLKENIRCPVRHTNGETGKVHTGDIVNWCLKFVKAEG